jgi:hypothetical protein
MIKLIPKKTINISSHIFVDDKKFISGSSSIIKHNKTNYVLLKRINYFIKGGSKTLNLIEYLDNNFNVIDSKIIAYDFKENIERDGIEDIKLFGFDNKIYYIGTFKHNKSDQISSDVFDFPSKIKENIINITFPSNFIGEKNWVFLIINPNCVLYIDGFLFKYVK